MSPVVDPPLSSMSPPVRQAPRAAWAGWLLEGVGGVLWVLALRALWFRLREPIGIYDEGILLTGAARVLAGGLLYRDFYTNYPPGVFLLLAGLFKVAGPSILVERWVGVFARVACGVLAGRLGGKLTGRRFSWLASGLVVLWESVLGTHAFAYVLAVPVALGAALLGLRAWETRRWSAWVAAGLALGGVSWFRHDLFVWGCGVLGAGGTLVALKRRVWRPEGRDFLGQVGGLALGTAVAVVPFWLPWLVGAGPGRVLDDLFLVMVRHAMPGRVLPMPPLFARGPVEGLSFPLPVWMHGQLEGAVLLSLLGPVLALLTVAWPGAARSQARGAAVLLGALSLAMWPQMLGRTDLSHAVYTVPPAALLLGAWVLRLGEAASPGWKRGAAGIVLVLALGPLHTQVRSAPPRGEALFPGLARASELPSPIDSLADSRRAALAFVEEHTRPEEPIFVGLTDHRFIFVNEVELYFLLGRQGGTRHQQFDPNVTNRLEIQQEIARDLDASGVRVVVLSEVFVRFQHEPNDSRKQGADFLDRYLKENFEVMQQGPPYWLLLRRSRPAGGG